MSARRRISQPRARRAPPSARRRASLCEALDRALDTGVVVMGELIVSVAGVDLLYLNLNVLVSSVETLLDALDERAPVAALPIAALPAAGAAADREETGEEASWTAG